MPLFSSPDAMGSISSFLLTDMMIAASPESRNSAPIAMVIHSTISSRYLTSNAPTAIAQRARNTLYVISFITYLTVNYEQNLSSSTV